MNMKKIMAAGIAATMAVTSLAAVASAAEQTFPMAQTMGTSEVKDVVTFYFTDNTNAGAGIVGTNVKGDTMKIALKNGVAWDKLTGVKMEVTGLRDNASTPITESYQFAAETNASGAATGAYILALKDNYVNKAGEANLTSFAKITGVKISISVKEEGINNANDYDNTFNGIWGSGKSLVDFTMGTTTILAPDGSPSSDLEKFAQAIANSAPADAWYGAEKSAADLYHFIPKTTDHTTIERYDVKLLAKTGAHNSAGIGSGSTNQNGNHEDGNQIQNGEGLGDRPNGFIGLASQVAKFFNKQTNGDIVFKFVNAAASNGTQWNNGGIPSTEVGLLGDAMKTTAFALFVNYESTTGALVSIGEVDADALTVTFPMDEILDALDGKTIGTVHDIYYAMNKGLEFKQDTQTVNFGNIKGKEGYLIESVTLVYDEDASDEDIVDGDEDEGDVDVDGDEDEGDEGDVEVDGDEDEGDGEVDGDTDEDDFPTEGDEETGDDENPGTGVALAVVPALMAAAAVVVSKKRK